MNWEELWLKTFLYFFTKRNCSAETAAKKALEAVMAYDTAMAQLTNEEGDRNATGSGTESHPEG